MRYCVIDFETTGLDPNRAEVVEFAAVRVDTDAGPGGETGLHIASLCKPLSPIPPEVTRVHGITDRMVRFADPFSAYLPSMLDFIGEDTLAAHNLPFDSGFLRAYCARAGIRFDPPGLCTLRMSRRLYPHIPSHALSAVAAHLGVKNGTYHRALGDAMTTARILLLMLKETSSNVK